MKITTEKIDLNDRTFSPVQFISLENNHNTAGKATEENYAKRIVVGSLKGGVIEIKYNPSREKKRIENLEFNSGKISYSTSNE